MKNVRGLIGLREEKRGETSRVAAKGAACSERDGVIVPRKRQYEKLKKSKK
jgi:hypothetical protein